MDLLLLEVPLDASALRLHLLPAAAASLWTWVAVLAAALGLWGIRALGFKPGGDGDGDGPPAIAASSSPTPPARSEEEPETAAQRGDDAGDRPEIRYAEETCSPRTRFTAYYRCCGPSSRSCRVMEEDDVEEVEAEEADGGKKSAAEALWNGNCGLRSGADAAMALGRRADLGWYRYLDLAALNGSVVRLWDGGRDGRFTATAMGFSSRDKY